MMMLSFRTALGGGATLVAKRLLKGLALAVILGPVTGVLTNIAKRLSRRFAGDDTPDYVSPSFHEPAGPEVLARAEDLVLDALRTGHKAGLTNAEVAQHTGLNPPVAHRRGEVTRSILTSLVERGFVSKSGQRYTVARN